MGTKKDQDEPEIRVEGGIYSGFWTETKCKQTNIEKEKRYLLTQVAD